MGRRPLGLLTPRAEANLPPHTQLQPHQGSPAKAGDGLGMEKKQGGKGESCGVFCWDSPPWEFFFRSRACPQSPEAVKELYHPISVAACTIQSHQPPTLPSKCTLQNTTFLACLSQGPIAKLWAVRYKQMFWGETSKKFP